MDFYARRVVDTQIRSLFAELPAISIEGARGVGKTTTALQRAGTFLALDDEPVLEVLRADPHLIDAYPPPVVIDDWSGPHHHAAHEAVEPVRALERPRLR